MLPLEKEFLQLLIRIHNLPNFFVLQRLVQSEIVGDVLNLVLVADEELIGSTFRAREVPGQQRRRLRPFESLTYAIHPSSEPQIFVCQ